MKHLAGSPPGSRTLFHMLRRCCQKDTPQQGKLHTPTHSIEQHWSTLMAKPVQQHVPWLCPNKWAFSAYCILLVSSCWTCQAIQKHASTASCQWHTHSPRKNTADRLPQDSWSDKRFSVYATTAELPAALNLHHRIEAVADKHKQCPTLARMA